MEVSTLTVEGYLRIEREDRVSNGILPSEVRIIDNLLSNSLAMGRVYDEILSTAPPGWHAVSSRSEIWQYFVGAVISTAAFWSPKQLADDRDAVKRVQELTGEIAKKAGELAALMRRRADYAEKHGVSTPDDYHPLDPLDEAATQSDCTYLFDSYLRDELDGLRHQFDLKYWPRTVDFIAAIGRMQSHVARPLDRITTAAMEGRQAHTPRDFIRALDARLDELREEFSIESDFSHRAFAEIANCALALPESETLTRDDVKAMRAYSRKGGRNKGGSI